MPYFITPKYVVKDLAYEKTIENGKVYYTVNNFNVYRLDSSYLKSSDTVNKNGKEISGHLVGNTRDTVFSGIGEIIGLPVQDSTKDQITSELNTLLANSKTQEIPSNNSLDVIISDDAVASDYITSGFNVNYKKYNGLRSAKGNVTYTTYDVINSQTSGGFEVESVNEHFINVYTPIQIAMPEVTATNQTTVNHTNTTSSSVILADDATFEVKIRCTNNNFEYYNNVDDYIRADFADYYYVICDFDIIYNGMPVPKGKAVRLPNTARVRDGYTYFYAQVAPEESLSRSESEHKIIVIAQASNAPDTMIEDLVDQELDIQVNKTKDVTERRHINDSGNNEVSFANEVEAAVSYNDPYYLEGYRFYGDGYYFAMQTVNVRTASRIYDFKISDCTDLSYKSAFRDSNNSLIGNNYYSGIRRLLVYTNNNKEFTRLLDRDDIGINGTSTTKTLPLGPYKHTTASYMSAPKLGYRIAFDVKTTGYYLPSENEGQNRSIRIKPIYYYISKDGSKLERNITLYYKDATDKYKQFVGSDYKIYFIPNDGYRYKSNSTTANISHMSKLEESLNIGDTEFYLTSKMMSSDDTNYIQSWYGEFKLPNTTIAVKNGDSVDKALKDGYIGVKFDIECVDLNLNETISYNKNNLETGSQINTTQWDYEGYLGFSNPGQEVTDQTSLRLQLEKGIWAISTQDVYDFVKGTVVLYDIDERAADDIQ